MKTLNFCLLGVLLFCSTLLYGTKAPKYIFLFIGDGMGMNHVELAQLYLEKAGTAMEEHSLLFPKFPVVTQVGTRSASHLITCSSAAATAIASGEKTANSVIGMDMNKKKVKSFAYQLKDIGYKVGIITSASIDHATPGGFYASQPKRSMYYEIGLDAANSGFNFFGGAGLLELRSKRNSSSTCLYDVFRDKGYTIYHGMEAYNRGDVRDRIILFPKDTACVSLKYSMDRTDADLKLSELTKICLDNFKETAKKGFFMMVEGARIDWAAHAHDGAAVVKETIDLDQCVRIAYEFYKKHPAETLILVTADHETGGLGLGNINKNLDVGLLKYQRCSQEALTAAMREIKRSERFPSWEKVKTLLKQKLGFWEQIPITPREELELLSCYENSFRNKQAKDVISLYAKDEPLAVAAVELLNTKAGLGWTTKSHTGAPVPLYVIGEQADLYLGRRDNTDILYILKNLFKLSK